MSRNCCTCEKESFYKCPLCRQPYCSIACYKIHKNSNCTLSNNLQDEKISEKNKSKVYKFPTEDTVPVEKLESLKHDEELRSYIKDPYVRDIINAVINDSNPTDSIAKAMSNHEFIKVADACLKVVEPLD
ncbi:zinc finger HIT domain-containing protein 3-like [Prorops nasuta]|uniref:zinc finger HIT domain-containing protein 3-like n=1 Tax=Prorops nasuta TaxID=863751 RepID=UPI0034CD385E